MTARSITGSRTRTSSRTSGGSAEPRDGRADLGCWHALAPEAALRHLHTQATGLNEAEASRRRHEVGANELPLAEGPSAVAILLQQFTSVVVWLLAGATAISLALGDRVEALAIAAVLVLNTAIGFAMEWRARSAMHALLQTRVASAMVIRQNQLRVVEARDLVPGDIIELIAGHEVPADARLLHAVELRVNEAALTGESIPVRKHADAVLPEAIPLADRTNMVYSGTTSMAGTGRAVVTATGRATEIGHVGELIANVAVQPTPLERRLDALGTQLVWLALGVAAIVVAINAAHGAATALLFETGIALAVAAVPEALPVVATIALAVGMKRMARRHAIVRRLTTVESLGSTTIVCTDKTRTLTSGQMSVVRTWPPDHPHTLLETAALATPAATDGLHRTHDPVDGAVIAAAHAAGIDATSGQRRRRSAGLIPFSSERKLMAAFYEQDDALVVAVKGAPLRVFDLCQLDAHDRALASAGNQAMASDGLRVLAVAAGRVSTPTEDALHDLELIGLIGLADPPAIGVSSTIARLRAAGLRTLMLTGDQSATACAVAREIGMISGPGQALDGVQLDAMSDAELGDALSTVDVFSRITPEHKLRIVSVLQSRGEIVAMLGDGVNDAPALRKADVGVAMGGRGTDAAKEAAGIVLANDRFDTIGAAVEEGRVIFDNLQKFVFYLFSCNLAEVLVLCAAGVAGLPLPLLPLQLLLLNIITDTAPALALAVEPAEDDVMNRPPRSPDQALLSRPFVTTIAGYAVLIAGVTTAVFVWGLARHPSAAQTMAFMTLALAQIAHLGNARSTYPVLTFSRAIANPAAIAAVGVAVLLQFATMFVTPLAHVLRLVTLTPGEWVLIATLAAVPALAGQISKRGRRPIRS